jgi:hypothetical protein
MVVEQISQTISVVVVIHYSVEPMSSESSVLDSVLIFAEHRDLFSVAVNLVEMTVSLVSVVVVVIVRLVPVVWEETV